MRMLEAIGSHHKSKQTNTFSDISIRKSVHIHTQRDRSLAKHSNPSGE